MITPILEWLWTAKPEWKSNRKLSDLSKSEKLLLISLVREELTELEDALMKNDEEEVYDAIVDIYWTATNTAAALGLQSQGKLIDKIRKVEMSNYSKFCETELEANITINAYKEGSHPSKPGQSIDCTYTKTPEGYYIVLDPKGKIMKSIHYAKPEEFD